MHMFNFQVEIEKRLNEIEKRLNETQSMFFCSSNLIMTVSMIILNLMIYLKFRLTHISMNILKSCSDSRNRNYS